jgi:hypothetical protein
MCRSRWSIFWIKNKIISLENYVFFFTKKPEKTYAYTWYISPRSQSQSHIATDGQLVSKSLRLAPPGAHDQIFITLTVTVLFLWGALSDEMMGLFLYTHAAGPCQLSLPRVRVPWDSRPYFTVSYLRLAGHGGNIRPHLHSWPSSYSHGTNHAKNVSHYCS